MFQLTIDEWVYLKSQFVTSSREGIRQLNKIYTIRGVQVMLDSYLVELYGYEVKQLNRQVKRNIERFPEDFMFELTIDEGKNVSRSQIATLEGKESSKVFLLKVNCKF